MKTVVAAIAYFAALMAVVWFGAGCATVGDGKLEPVTKGAAKAAKNDKDKIALLMRAVFGKDAQ